MGSRGGGSKTRVSDYYLAAHVGVCHGPVEAVLEVVVGEKLAWQGSSAPSNGSPVDGHDVAVDNPGLFGGNKKEGGVRGTMTVMHGAPNQLAPSKIAQFLGLARDKVPGYRGILSLLFHSADGRDGFMWSSNNPYLKPLWVKVRARPGTWYPEKAMIDGDANPMHIIRECLVNTDWGMGAASKSLDDAQMRQIADVLYSERFGLSLMWAQQTEIEKFIGEILRHINGTMCVNPRTGKFHFKLIREDYTQGSLPSFNRDQGTIRTSQRKAWDETVNEINVSWTNPASEETEVITVHDPANITIQGAVVPDSRDMYGIRNIDLATRVAMREIQVASKPLLQVEVDFDRSAFGLLPGDAIKLVDWKELNFAEVVMRVVDINYGTPDSMVIKASLVEDVFGQPAVYTAEDPNRWQSSAEDPVPMVTWEVMTAPYFMVARLLGETRAQSMTYPAVYPVVLAAPEGKDTNTYVQQAQRGSITGTGPVWQNSYDRVPVGHATLVDALPIGAVGSATLTGLKGRVYAETGNYLYIGGQNGEICLITDTSTGALTLRRGCMDTSPRAWPAGTPVWLVDDNRHGFDEELSAYGATQNYRLLPTTSKGQLPVNLAPVISGVMSDRPFRPYPPANVRVNGDLFPSAKPLPLSFTWSERNRILETSVVLPWDGAGVPAEPGTTYTFELDAFVGNQWQANSVAVRSATITAFDVSADILPSNTTAIRFRLWTEKDGLRSWTNVEHTFAIGDSGTGLPPGSGVEFGPPPKPVSVLVTARRNSIKLEPQFTSVDKFACEYWRSRVPLKEAEIETEAVKVGQGMFVDDTGLAIDTAYFYFLRAVNTYGKSGWYAMETRTKIDPQEILDEMDGLIDSSKLTPELQEDLEKLPGLEVEVGKLPALEQSIERISVDAEHAALGVLSVATAATKSEERRLASEASIKDSQVVLADEQQALASRLELFSTKFETDLSEANTAIRNETTARSTADAAQAQQITDIDTKFTTDLAETNANLASSVKALTDADKAIIEKVDSLETSFEGDLSAVNAAVQQEAIARSDADAAQAQLINSLDAKFSTGLSNANAAITEEAAARAEADSAQASMSTGLKAEIDLSGEASLSNALKDFEGEQRQLKASADIRTEMNVVVDDQKALAERVDVVESSFETEIGKTNAAITNLARSTTTADQALAESVSSVRAEMETADNALSAEIRRVETASATADQALAESVDSVQAELNGTVATVQQHSQSIVDLEGGAQAMWSVKAQAGEITAGIGLIADQATGKSQVLVNASQFFVFDNAVGKTAVFAIDQGQVIIRDAVIRKATIDILNTTEITAKNVKAGQAGFGEGGSYPMFGQNWHTTISSDGSVKTDRMYAAGGWIANMTIGNCTITENCVVLGTIYANKIVGDVSIARPLKRYAAGGTLQIVVEPANMDRTLFLSNFGVLATNTTPSPISNAYLAVSIYMNGSQVFTEGDNVNLASQASVILTKSAELTIPAGVRAAFSVNAEGASNLNKSVVPHGVLVDSRIAPTGHLFLFKSGSSI